MQYLKLKVKNIYAKIYPNYRLMAATSQFRRCVVLCCGIPSRVNEAEIAYCQTFIAEV